MPTTQNTVPVLRRSVFVTVATEHGSNCIACEKEAKNAAIMARVTGSRGATHSDDSPRGYHSATVDRAEFVALGIARR